MDAAIKLRSFESGYKALVSCLLTHEVVLSSQEYGDGSAWIEKLLLDHEKYHEDSQQSIAKSKELFHFGRHDCSHR